METTHLPEGTVTFLMTDVEGSTPLWEADPGAMVKAMARHDEIIERAVAEHAGVVVKPRGEGDSRFCVFRTASEAVAAAIGIQRALALVDWPTRDPIRVRIALHTGHAEVRDPEYGEYYGNVPNRCARLRDLGHGGQVLLSSSAAAALGEPDGVELIPLGAYRLRGIELPEPVHQLAHPELIRDFPPLRGGAPGNLPTPLTSFIGRSSEIEDVAASLETRRLLSLTGAAGVGKTRLAIEVARSVSARFPDGVWFCDLAPVRSSDVVLHTLIGTFGLAEERERSLEEILADYVRTKRLLVILDNCEHLVAACAELCARLLTLSPDSSILVTSREPLGAEGETTRRVSSLSVPEDEEQSPQQLADSEAVALFCERARAQEQSFVLDDRVGPLVAQICRRLDGIPLAIELAAGKVTVLDVGEIAAGVEDRFALLTGGPRTVLERQQTMRAAVDWSYSLLSEDERVVLRRLGVFVGGFTMESARDVCAAHVVIPEDVPELIASLVRKSLVARASDQAGRYLLLETIRAYAAEKLADAGEASDARRDHLRFFCALAARAAGPLEGGPDTQDWLDRLAADHDNLQAAMAFAVSADPDAGLRLAADIALYGDTRGHYGLGLRALETLLAATGEASTIDRARALLAVGVYTAGIDDNETARARLEQSLAIAREVGDRALIARVLEWLGVLAHRRGDLEGARARYEESLAIARELGRRVQIGRTVHDLGGVAHVLGDYEVARAQYEESLAIAREVGDRRLIAWVVGHLGEVAHLQGDYEAARAQYEESLAIAREVGDRRLIATVVGGLGTVAQRHGDYQAAHARYEESLAIARELGARWLIAAVVGNLGTVARNQGDYDTARARCEESLALARELGDRRLIARGVGNLGGVAYLQGDYDTARARYEESLALARQIGDHPEIAAESLRGCAMVAEATGVHELACQLAAAADATRERVGFHLDPFEQAQFGETLARLRGAMDEEAFDAAWARGRALSLEEAIDLALGL